MNNNSSKTGSALILSDKCNHLYFSVIKWVDPASYISKVNTSIIIDPGVDRYRDFIDMQFVVKTCLSQLCPDCLVSGFKEYRQFDGSIHPSKIYITVVNKDLTTEELDSLNTMIRNWRQWLLVCPLTSEQELSDDFEAN